MSSLLSHCCDCDAWNFEANDVADLTRGPDRSKTITCIHSRRVYNIPVQSGDEGFGVKKCIMSDFICLNIHRSEDSRCGFCSDRIDICITQLNLCDQLNSFARFELSMDLHLV